MCSLAPFALPAGCFDPVAPPRRTMVATYAVEAPLPSAPPCCYEYDAVEIEGMFCDIDAFLQQPIPAMTPRPMPSAEFLAHDGVNAPACTAGFDNTKTEASKKKRPDEPSWTYDADIDATLRKMEKDQAERPSEDYLWTTQKMTMLDRAKLVTWMYEFFLFHGLVRETLHRAVSYVDRFLSAKKMDGGRADDLHLLGAAAVFTASKYEDRKTVLVLNADDVAQGVGSGCTRRHVLAAERDLVAVLGYRLSGPTAYTFVEHFTRHDDDHETDDGRTAMIKSVAHHLADMTLLDFRCVSFLPSAVATAAVLLARRVVNCGDEEQLLEMTGYTIKDLTDIIDVIYDMHDLEDVWPGCARMMDSCIYRYSLPRR